MVFSVIINQNNYQVLSKAPARKNNSALISFLPIDIHLMVNFSLFSSQDALQINTCISMVFITHHPLGFLLPSPQIIVISFQSDSQLSKFFFYKADSGIYLTCKTEQVTSVHESYLWPSITKTNKQKKTTTTTKMFSLVCKALCFPLLFLSFQMFPYHLLSLCCMSLLTIPRPQYVVPQLYGVAHLVTSARKEFHSCLHLPNFYFKIQFKICFFFSYEDCYNCAC